MSSATAAQIINLRPIRATIIDVKTVEDLVLHVENDGVLYRSHTLPLINMLQADKAAGKYNKENAAILFYEIVRDCLPKFRRQWGYGQDYIAHATLFEAAKQLLDGYSDHIEE